MKLQLILLDDLFYRGTGPTGPQGAQGPAGPTGDPAVTAYSYKYENGTEDYTLTQNNTSQVLLSDSGPNNNINNGDTNSFTITIPGIYKIDYFFLGSSSVQTNLTLEVRQNNTAITGSEIIKEVEANEDNAINGSILVNLSVGDVIDLGITSSSAATVTPGNDTNAYLILLKIG